LAAGPQRVKPVAPPRAVRQIAHVIERGRARAMFIGHYAPALIAAAQPRAPGLGTLFIAAQLADYGFFSLAMLGVERMRFVPGITAMNPMDLYYMPFTHSLMGTLVMALAFGVLVFLLSRNRTGAMLAAMVVLSHWALDFLVHRPDLTIAGTPPKLGLGLWNHPLIEMPIEIGLICAGMAYYLVRTRIRQGESYRALYLLVASLAVFQAFNWFGPVETAYRLRVSIVALVVFTVLAGLAMWFGMTRAPRRPTTMAAAG